MIITAEEYRNMGFSAKDSTLLESCLLRAEYTIAGITEGRYKNALATGGEAAECIKQAAAFQTSKLVKDEELLAAASGEKTGEKVSIGDYSYEMSSEHQSATTEDTQYDLNMQTVRLLRASGCLFGGREVTV